MHCLTELIHRRHLLLDGDVVKNALIGLAVAAVAAGASAVMNLKEGEDKDNE